MIPCKSTGGLRTREERGPRREGTWRGDLGTVGGDSRSPPSYREAFAVTSRDSTEGFAVVFWAQECVVRFPWSFRFACYFTSFPMKGSKRGVSGPPFERIDGPGWVETCGELGLESTVSSCTGGPCYPCRAGSEAQPSFHCGEAESSVC